MRRKIVLIISILLMLSRFPCAWAQEDFSLKELSFTINSEGLVVVELKHDVDPTELSIDIPIFGDFIENLLVLDQDELPLEATEIDSGLRVETFGSTEIEISYITPTLTGKLGAIWSFNTSTSITSMITLPEYATIIDLSSIPLEINTINGQTSMLMEPGITYIAYTIDILDSETIAINTINVAEVIIEDAKSEGIILTQAEVTLTQAKQKLEEKQYIEALNLATQTIETAETIIEEAEEAQTAIETVSNAIEIARNSGKTIGLEEAENLLIEAQSSFDAGDYFNASIHAEQALEAALNAESSNGFQYMLIIGVIAILIGLYLYYQSKTGIEGGSTSEVKPIFSPKQINVEAIFERHPDLRIDDKEVIRFLAERGGEAFANEIRERFDIPRTSAWRLIRRLMRYEIVDERKIGGQSLVSIADEFKEEAT